MKGTLKKNQIVDSKYEVLFFIRGDKYCEQYRVKGVDQKNYLLKLYNSSNLSTYDFSKKTLLEVEILDALNIENVTKLHDHGEISQNQRKFHYLVQKFISGETIQDKLNRDGVFSQFSAIPTCIYLLEILKGLHEHSNTIIHNNINPTSIFLDYSNGEKPTLSEFGFARYFTSSNNSIELNRLSKFFTAPELNNGIFTPQSDLFSVGAVLYYLISGIPPWYFEVSDDPKSADAISEKLTQKRKENLSFGPPDIDNLIEPQLKATIRKALSIDVNERFQSIDEFISALKGEYLTSHPQTSKKEEQKQIKKRIGSGFSAIAGMQKLKDLLYNDVIRALEEKDLYNDYGLTIPNGMLLYGPPGCGKTFISERFAEEVGFNFLQLKPSDIKSKYINETEEKIGSIFQQAAENAPTIIFIDEIDAVVPNRESNLHQMQAAPVNEFLAQMSNCSEKGIFVIAASNRPENIDPAILRTGRIDRVIYLPPPDFEARVLMFKLHLKKRPIDLSLDYEILAKRTENYVSSDIKFLVDEASRQALKTKSRITQEIFENVFSINKPSISNGELKRYEMLKNNMEKSKKDDSEPRKPIGF